MKPSPFGSITAHRGRREPAGWSLLSRAAGPKTSRWRLAQHAPDSRQGRALERFRIFLHPSGLRQADRRQVAEAVVASHDWSYAIVTEAAAASHRGFAEHWRMVAEHATRARRWCQRHQRDLITAA